MLHINVGPIVIFYGRGWYSWRRRGCFRYGNLIDLMEIKDLNEAEISLHAMIKVTN